jgi:outer membrane protein insertion porin family
MTMADRFYLGGPLNIRGFDMRGLGPSSENCTMGGLSYWAAGFHIYTPLPFFGSAKGFSDLFRTHVFVNAGNLLNDYQFDSNRGLQSNFDTAVQNFRLTYGLGLALKLGGIARIELNYCVPIRTQNGDKPTLGLQFGVGVNFL